MRKIFKKSLILFSAFTICFGTAIPKAQAVSSGVGSELDTYLSEAFEAANIPGAAVIISDDQNTLLSNTYGDCGGANEPFIIGSISKTFTADAIMQLVEKGKVELDAPLSRYLKDSAEGQHITIRQLLNHTSGIDTYMTLDNYSITSKQGTYVYANANYGLLGKVIEAVSGISYGKYLEANIFRPLGMEHTYTSLEEAKKDGLIAGYRNYFGFAVSQECDYPDKSSKGWLTIPAGYIISTAADMNRYLKSYLNENVSILTSKSIASMFGETVPVAKGNSYGLGWGILDRDGTKIISHGGLVDNYTCQAFMIPKLKISGVILMNSNDYFVGNAMTGDILLHVLDMLLGKTPTRVKGMGYVMSHILLDTLYLCLVLISLFPLLLIGIWRRKTHSKRRSILVFTLLHVLFPSVLLLIPVMLKVPMYVVARFAPDFFLIIVVSAAIAYLTGFLKIALMLRIKKKIQAESKCSPISEISIYKEI